MKTIITAIALLFALTSQSVSAACANNKPFCACNQSGDVCVACLNSGGFFCGLRLKSKIENTQSAAVGSSRTGTISAKPALNTAGSTKTKEIEIQKCDDLRKSVDFKNLEKKQRQDVMSFCKKQLKKAKKQLSQK